MELAKLKYFYETAKLEHVTKAAEKLCIAQPALTQAIKSLETELDVPLFYKKGRNILLTEYGAFLKNSLDIILPQIDLLPEQLNALKNGLSKRVKLNINAISSFVVEKVLEFRAKHDDLTVDFEQNESGGDYDIIISTCRTPSMKRRNHTFFKEDEIRVVIPISSPLSKQDGVSIEDLKKEKFVMLSGSRLFRKVCNEICAAAGFAPEIFFESDSPAAVQNVVSAGTGVAFWSSLWGEIDNGKVKCLRLTDTDSKRFVTVELTDSASRSAFAKELYGYIVEKLKEF